MKILRTSLFLAAVLVAASGSATAQMGPGGMSGHRASHHEGHQGSRMEKMHEHRSARHQQHLGELKTKLQLQASQEAAWTAFADAMQPPVQPHARAQRAAMDKLTTPERIEQMQAMHAQHEATMKKRAQATLTFYASLDTEQKKTFDAETARFMGKGPMHGRH